jgi:hypothetical protein
MIIRDANVYVLKENEGKYVCDITLNKVKCEAISAKCVYDRTQDSTLRCVCNPELYYNKSKLNCVTVSFTAKIELNFKIFNPTK